MTDLRKAAEMALEAWEKPFGERAQAVEDAIEELRQALAQPPVDWEAVAADQAMTIAMMKIEQEPMAHLWECIGRWTAMVAHDGEDANLAPPDWLVDAVKTATEPPKREWVGLTDEEIGWIWHNSPPNSHEYARAIEAKLKEKNT